MRSTNTRLFALLGDPVAHSLSPLFQNAGFRAAGLDAVYVALRTKAVDIPAMMQTLVASGGGGNVTVPHKQVAATVAGVPSLRVQHLGAANLFGHGDAGMVLDNTDVDGILRALTDLEADGRDWCVLGTGGSARAVVGAAKERGARVAVRSRDSQRQAEFASWMTSIGVEPCEPGSCQVVINATPLGLHSSDPLPASPDDFENATVALDLTYQTQGTTAWCEQFAARGCRASDGRAVLLHQGAASWRVWFPRIPPPIEVMRAALHGQMG